MVNINLLLTIASGTVLCGSNDGKTHIENYSDIALWLCGTETTGPVSVLILLYPSNGV